MLLEQVRWAPTGMQAAKHSCMLMCCLNLLRSQPLSLEAVRQAAAHRHGGECLVFVNPPALQSVRTVWHAHVLVATAGCVEEHKL